MKMYLIEYYITYITLFKLVNSRFRPIDINKNKKSIDANNKEKTKELDPSDFPRISNNEKYNSIHINKKIGEAIKGLSRITSSSKSVTEYKSKNKSIRKKVYINKNNNTEIQVYAKSRFKNKRYLIYTY